MRKSVLALVSLCCSAAWAADPMIVSAASPNIGITADSLASVYGDKIATVTASAQSLPWPTSLGDISVVYVLDSASQLRMASVFYVSPTQMNIWIPPETAPGPAAVEFPATGLPPGVEAAALRIVPVTIQKVAPALFTVDGNVAAASAVRVVIPTGIQSPVPVFLCDAPVHLRSNPDRCRLGCAGLYELLRNRYSRREQPFKRFRHYRKYKNQTDLCRAAAADSRLGSGKRAATALVARERNRERHGHRGWRHF